MLSLALNLVLTLKDKHMKKLAMALALVFTMGLAASSVNAATTDKDNNKKAKTECCSKDKKECCKKDSKTCCSKDAKTDTSAKEKK